MTITLPAHPQILLALGNWQSMDGGLSGAIYTGSGAIPHPLFVHVDFTGEFHHPGWIHAAGQPGSGGVAPLLNYGGTLFDNSDSRLNVAKAGITAILNAFIASADFGLMDYETGYPGLYTTWVYQMSNPGGFTFTALPLRPQAARWSNPCYQINVSAGFAISQDCNILTSYYSRQTLR